MSEPKDKTLQLNVRLKPSEPSAHPKATNYTNVGVAQEKRKKGTGYFFGEVRGRPRGRSVDSRPKRRAILICQVAVPKGCCRFTQVRSAMSSCSKRG